MEVLIDFVKYALPSGFLSGVFTWLISRRKSNNDMLSNLQASINLLCEENRKVLTENLKLRSENVELKANQQEMLTELTRLRKEVERLRQVVSKFNNENDNNKTNRIVHPAHIANNSNDGLPNERKNQQDAAGSAIERKRYARQRKSKLIVSERDGRIDQEIEADQGRDSSVAESGESSDSKPP